MNIKCSPHVWPRDDGTNTETREGAGLQTQLGKKNCESLECCEEWTNS